MHVSSLEAKYQNKYIRRLTRSVQTRNEDREGGMMVLGAVLLDCLRVFCCLRILDHDTFVAMPAHPSFYTVLLQTLEYDAN